MFLKFKTKFYFFKIKKKSILILFIFILLISIFIIFNYVLKNKNANQSTINVVPNENNNLTENTNDIIYGTDIKNKLNEVKGKDFAVLVTTIDLLKGIDTNESEEYYKYIIDNEDTNRISVIQDADGNLMDALLVNYNRLLKDTVITKDISGGYITPYGFTDKSETKFNNYVENKSIIIKDDAVFSEYPIYDGYYEEIGILYIEEDK